MFENSNGQQDIEKEWDNSGKVEEYIYKIAKDAYNDLKNVEQDLENKANRILTRDFIFIGLYFTSLSLLARESFIKLYWFLFTINSSLIIIFLAFAIMYSLRAQIAVDRSEFSPANIIDATSEAPSVIRVNKYLNYELEKAAQEIIDVNLKRSQFLEKSIKFESYAAYSVMSTILITIFFLI